MRATLTRKNVTFVVNWVLVTTLGWSVGLLQGRITSVASAAELVNAALMLSLQGLLVGVVMGGLQSVVLWRFSKEARYWAGATLLGCWIAEVLGIAIALLLPWSILNFRGIVVWNVENLGWTFTPIPLYIIFSGFSIGLFQSFVLRRIFPNLGRKAVLLWIIGTWAGIGLGVFIGGWVEGKLLSSINSYLINIIIERIVTGVVLGLITSSLLHLFKGDIENHIVRSSI